MIVLDTHVFIWLMEGDSKILRDKKFLELIENNITSRTIFISDISLWEVAMLESKGRISLSQPLEDWMNQALLAPGIQKVSLSPKIINDSVNLPGHFHSDPSDRLIVSTARVLSAELITKDKEIIKYGKTGHLKVHALG